MSKNSNVEVNVESKDKVNVESIEAHIKKMINTHDPDGDTPLIKAIKRKNIEDVKKLINLGADVNLGRMLDISPLRGTPLMIASSLGLLDIVELLIDNKSELDFKTPFGETALMLSICSYHFDIAKFLILKGADINLLDYESDSALILSCVFGSLDLLKLLISKGSDVNQIGNKGMNSLMHAARSGHPDIVEYLIQLKVDVNNRDYNGWTALHHASTEQVAKLLVEKGASFKYVDNEGRDPLTVAYENERDEVAKYLIELQRSTSVIISGEGGRIIGEYKYYPIHPNIIKFSVKEFNEYLEKISDKLVVGEKFLVDSIEKNRPCIEMNGQEYKRYITKELIEEITNSLNKLKTLL